MAYISNNNLSKIHWVVGGTLALSVVALVASGVITKAVPLQGLFTSSSLNAFDYTALITLAIAGVLFTVAHCVSEEEPEPRRPPDPTRRPQRSRPVRPIRPRRQGQKDLIPFYRGTAPNVDGTTFDQILDYFTRGTKVSGLGTHAIIQWIFPLKEPSQFNPTAPLLTDVQIAQFKSDPELLAQADRAFAAFMTYLGLKYEEGKVVKDPSRWGQRTWDEPQGTWLTSENHNYRRFTRVMAFMRHIGKEKKAQAFYQCLVELPEASGKFSADNKSFWRKAAGL